MTAVHRVTRETRRARRRDDVVRTDPREPSSPRRLDRHVNATEVAIRPRVKRRPISSADPQEHELRPPYRRFTCRGRIVTVLPHKPKCGRCVAARRRRTATRGDDRQGACVARASRSTPRTTARPRSRRRRSPTTTSSCSTELCRSCTVTSCARAFANATCNHAS